jgi:IS30 family transposase
MRIHEIISEADTDPKLIQRMKDLWDQGYSSKEISNALGWTKSQIGHNLNRHYHDREGKRKPHPPELIARVGELWDEIPSPTKIAKELGKTVQEINTILYLYHSDRINKFDNSRSLTDQEIQDIISSYSQGETTNSISRKYKVSPTFIQDLIMREIGKDAYDEIMNSRRLVPGAFVPNKMTDEMKETIIKLFVSGYNFTDIKKQINDVLVRSTISKFLKNHPNWNQMLQAHKLARDQKKPQVATTKRMTSKPMSKGIKAIRKIGPVTGGKL